MFGSILSMLSGAGSTPSANFPSPTAKPTLDELTLNPQLMGGAPVQPPYATGQGPYTMRPPNQSPMAPSQGGPEAAAGKTTGEKVRGASNAITDVGKAIMAAGKFQDAMGASPLAQQMFQEQQAGQMAANQMHQNKIEEFRRKDLSSQILEKYGLL